MAERPILFKGEMVRAILAGRKTQTRLVLKPQPDAGCEVIMANLGTNRDIYFRQPHGGMSARIKGKVHVGDNLWVRETWRTVKSFDHLPPSRIRAGAGVVYEADQWNDGYPCGFDKGRIRKSIFMPRWASRITLRVTDVRIQRLQDITEEDARAEGIVDGGCLNCGNNEPCGCSDPQPDARDGFAELWQPIHGAHSWHINPWVVAYTFEREGGAK